MTATDEPTLDDALGVEPRALTGLNQPLWLQNSTYPASLDRQLIASALGPGVIGPIDLAVTQRAAGANMSVDVLSGRVVVPVTDAPNLGAALCTSTATNNLTVSGAPAAGTSRIDLVIARVYDASIIGGSINGWQLEIVTGTAAASPAAPALPASSIELARFTVASGTASITNAMISDRRAVSRPPLLPWGRMSEVFPVDSTFGGATVITGSAVTLPSTANRRHLVTATGTVRKNDTSIGTANIWLESPGGVHDRDTNVSMSGSFSVPFQVRFTYINRPGIGVILAASCDVTLATITRATMTVDDVGPQ